MDLKNVVQEHNNNDYSLVKIEEETKATQNVDYCTFPKEPDELDDNEFLLYTKLRK